MAKSTLYDIYADLVKAVKDTVGEKNVFLKERPNAKSEELPMSRFLVLDLPTAISDFVIGGQKTMLRTSGIIYAFVQSRSDNTLNVNATGDLIDSICALFPISGKSVVATNPQVIMRGADGQGFQVTSISFDLRCRWGAFNSKT